MKRVAALLITLALIAGTVGCPADPEPIPPNEYTLTISSNEGGEVIAPGEGVFTYDKGTVVILTATPVGGYEFASWAGDVSTVGSLNARSTTITMNDHYSITANFEPDPLQIRAQRAMEIHEQAIDMVLEEAEHDNYYRYAIYTSRSLMVKHPEIYLKADRLFLDTVQNNAGFKRSYEITSVSDPYLLGRSMIGPPFSFDLVDFAKYKIIESSDMYPEHYPFLPYVDRRLLTMTVTLKSVDNRVTQLAKAEQYYFALSEGGANPDLMYIIYCDNENAYLYHEGELVAALNLENTEHIQGNPVLIMNETSVWYPLMGRDDSGDDATLRTIVEQYTTSAVMPELTDFEAGLAPRFAEVTALKASEVNMAVIAAAREPNKALPHNSFNSIWARAGIINMPLGHGYANIGLIHDLILKSNHLSPIAAYLAAIAEEKEGEDKVAAVCREYLRHASPPEYSGMAHGHIWVCGIMESNIEDSYYAHSGCCTTQAANIKASLDLAGVAGYWIHALSAEPPVSGHSHVYIPGLDMVVDNGRVSATSSRRSVLCGEFGSVRPCVTLLACRGKWANLYTVQEFCGTLSPTEAIEVFEYLSSIHGDEIRGLTYGGVPISSEALLDHLRDHAKTWRAVALPCTAEVLFAGGSGTEEDPYQIADWHHLHNVRYYQHAHFILTDNMDATTAGYAEVAGATADGGRGWKPIGTGHHPFTGVFDGCGYRIGDVLINRPDEEGVAFFHEVGQQGVIRNIGLANANVVGLGRVGGLVAWNHGAVINSYVNVNVTGEVYGLLGGLVAINEGTVIDSYSAGSVIGASPIGGLVGQNYHGTVSGSYAIGSVTSDGVCVGGLVGDNVGGTVSNSYATGSVTGHAHVGGLVGQNCFGAAVSNSYSTGRVTGEGYSHVGGLVGANGSDATVSSSFWNIETSGVTESGGGTGKTTAQMKSITTFKGAGWHISGVGSGETNTTYTWNIVDGQTYPFLSWQTVS